MFKRVENRRIHYEIKEMLAYFMPSENLPTFFERYVGKIVVNLKNVQHRQDSTR